MKLLRKSIKQLLFFGIILCQFITANAQQPNANNRGISEKVSFDTLVSCLEKKNNIKLMKSIQQFKMNAHQSEYYISELRE